MANIYVKANIIQQTDQIRKDLVAIRSLLISSLYFSLHTRKVAIKYHNIKPQKTRYPGITIFFMSSKFHANRTSPLI